MELPGNSLLFTIERPWLNNAPNISCIPEGIYTAKYLPTSASGKYTRVWHLLNVPGRTGVLIHAANKASQLQGCIAPGKSVGTLGGEPAVLQSAAAMGDMRTIIGSNDFMLIIMPDNRSNFQVTS